MDFRTLWLTSPMPTRHRIARKVGSTYKYLQKLSGHFGQPSLDLIRRLIAECPELDMESFVNPPEVVPAKRGTKLGQVTKRRKSR